MRFIHLLISLIIILVIGSSLSHTDTAYAKACQFAGQQCKNSDECQDGSTECGVYSCDIPNGSVNGTCKSTAPDPSVTTYNPTITILNPTPYYLGDGGIKMNFSIQGCPAKGDLTINFFNNSPVSIKEIKAKAGDDGKYTFENIFKEEASHMIIQVKCGGATKESSFSIQKQPGAVREFFLTINPSSALVEDDVTVSAKYCKAGTDVQFTWTKDGGPELDGDKKVEATGNGADGEASFTQKFSEGGYLIDSMCLDNGKASRASLIVGVKPPDTPTPTPVPPLLPCERYSTDGKQCEVVLTAFGPIDVQPGEMVKSIFILILSLSGGIALLLIILSGYKLMTSQGDPEKVKDARDTLTSAIVGLLFIIFSLVILETIGVDILNLPGFTK